MGWTCIPISHNLPLLNHLSISRVREEDPENVIVSTLSTLTGGSPSSLGRSSFFGGDLEAAASIMRTVANRIRYLLQTQSGSFYRKEEYVAEVFANILRSASSLLSRRQRESWHDLLTSRQMKVATALLASLEENARLLADVAKDDEYLEEATKEVGTLHSQPFQSCLAAPPSFHFALKTFHFPVRDPDIKRDADGLPSPEIDLWDRPPSFSPYCTSLRPPPPLRELLCEKLDLQWDLVREKREGFFA